MKKRIGLIALCAAFGTIIACGDESSSAPPSTLDDVAESSSSEVLASSSSKKVASSSSEKVKSSSSEKEKLLSSEKMRSSSSLQAKSSSSEQAKSSSSETVQSSSSLQVSSSSSEKLNSLSSEQAKSSSSVQNNISSSFEQSSSSNESSSSLAEYNSDFLTFDGDPLIKPNGYYERNCPQGIDCKYVSTEYLNKDKLVDGSYGEYLDVRDGQVYKVVRIQQKFSDNDVIDQVWLAQNLNYAYKGRTASLDSSSFCLNGIADSCARYGRLYLWSAAMDSAGIAGGKATQCGVGQNEAGYTRVQCSVKDTVQGVCPQGFHLPLTNDFYQLYRATGGYYEAGKNNRIRLLWDLGDSGYKKEGADVYGLSIMPGGSRDDDGFYSNSHTTAIFWSSSHSVPYSEIYILRVKIQLESTSVIVARTSYSVRCIRD